MKALKISSSLVCPFNDIMVSSSSLQLMSSNTILIKTHNCATFTMSVELSNGREKYFHASMNFLSCTSTAFPSHCLVEVFWESCTFYGLHALCFIAEVFKKASCCFGKRLPSQYRHLRITNCVYKDVTDVIGSNSCGLTLGSRFGED